MYQIFHLKGKHVYVKLAPILVVSAEACIFLECVRDLYSLGYTEDNLKIWEIEDFALNAIFEREQI